MPSGVLSSIETLRGALGDVSHEMSRQELALAASGVLRLYTDIQKQINASAPINTLPPELLVLVFKDVMALCRYRWTLPADSLRQGDPGDSAVIRLTHVCTLWRDVAIRCPSLWAHVDGHKQDKFAAFLERSQHLPTSVVLREVDVDGHQKAAFQDMLVRSGSRLRRLDLVSQSLPNIIASVLSFHAPSLECLTISSSDDLPGSFDDYDIQRFPILKEAADSLKALAIAPLVTWFPTNPFPALTHLYLESHPETPGHALGGHSANTPQLTQARVPPRFWPQ